MAIPTFSLDLAPPGRMTMPAVVGGAVEGGRSLSGLVSTMDMTGSGLVTVAYKAIGLGNASPANMRYLSQLAAILNSGVRSILVPLLVDFIEPGGSGTTGSGEKLMPFSDGATFSDTARFSQPGVGAVLASDAGLNAGTVSLTIAGADLFGGEWFEVQHPTRLSRAYCITEIDAVSDAGDGNKTYTVGIRPTLREAVSAATPLRFNRPRCLMRLAPGTTITLEVENYWWATPDISFIESFGSV